MGTKRSQGGSRRAHDWTKSEMGEGETEAGGRGETSTETCRSISGWKIDHGLGKEMYPKTPRREIPKNALPAWAGRTCSKVRGQEAVNSGNETWEAARPREAFGRRAGAKATAVMPQFCGSYCFLLILEQWLKAHAPSGGPTCLCSTWVLSGPFLSNPMTRLLPAGLVRSPPTS